MMTLCPSLSLGEIKYRLSSSTMTHADDAAHAGGDNQDQVKELLCQLQREKRTRRRC